MIQKYYSINKSEGQTPLEALETLRSREGIDVLVPMTYAGRLDPMAEGLLLILVGDECKNKDKYLGLDKEYEIEVLVGISSDTGDILGIVKKQAEISDFRFENLSKELIGSKVAELVGRRFEKYPAFSSKPIDGKPMFVHAKEGTLAEMNNDEVPQKEIEIYSIDLIGTEIIEQTKLVEIALSRINKVKGDFRQDKIINSWQSLHDANVKFSAIKLRVKASSGAYMRTLAQKLGESLGTKALAWKIKRIKIGQYSL